MGREDPQLKLRLPEELRDRLKRQADRHGRSMNAEIVRRLENSFKGWPRPQLSDELFERVRSARIDKREALEREIDELVVQAVERALPRSGTLHQQFSETFSRLLERASPDEAKSLQTQFDDLWMKMVSSVAKGPK